MKIQSLTLPSSNIDSMREFYSKVLGLKLVEQDGQSFTLQAGSTRLTFSGTKDGKASKHHLAFNIPPNLFQEAKAWLAARTVLVRGKEGQVEFDFSNWNALGMYFIDPDGNIGELIARDMLPPVETAGFSAEHILSVSEIGIPVADVPGTVALLRQSAGLQPYRGETETFAAVGDENGLLIVVQQGREWYPKTGVSAEFSPMEILIGSGRQTFLLQLGEAGLNIQEQ
jgi:catechol-2,3-dioxygenase